MFINNTTCWAQQDESGSYELVFVTSLLLYTKKTNNCLLCLLAARDTREQSLSEYWKMELSEAWPNREAKLGEGVKGGSTIEKIWR